MTNIKPALVYLAQLSEVREALAFLASVKVVREEAIITGCKKFIADHPEINEYLAKIQSGIGK